MAGSLFFWLTQALISPVPFTADNPRVRSGANTEQVSQSVLGLGHFPSGQSVLLSSQDFHSDSPGQGGVRDHCLPEGGWPGGF